MPGVDEGRQLKHALGLGAVHNVEWNALLTWNKISFFVDLAPSALSQSKKVNKRSNLNRKIIIIHFIVFGKPFTRKNIFLSLILDGQG